MKTLVVYDSAFGNTERVARAVGGALGSPDEVAVVRVGDLQPDGLAGVEVLVVGSPTQKFRPTAAASAFVRNLPADRLSGVRVAAFDTRISVREAKSAVLSLLVRLLGPDAYAAQRLADGLERCGGTLVAPPEGFFVEGMDGPLKAGELERAAAWAAQLAMTSGDGAARSVAPERPAHVPV